MSLKLSTVLANMHGRSVVHNPVLLVGAIFAVFKLVTLQVKQMHITPWPSLCGTVRT